MQCRASLRRPLRDIIRSIGSSDHYEWSPHTDVPTIPRLFQLRRRDVSTSAAATAESAYASTAAGEPYATPYESLSAQVRSPQIRKVPPKAARRAESRNGRLNAVSEQASEDVSDVVDKARRSAGYKTSVRANFRYASSIEGARTHQEHMRAKRARVLEEHRPWQHQIRWRTILEMLYDTTLSGADSHKRRVERFHLPDGVAARFNDHTADAILEIMLRSGCHVQLLPSVRKNTFSGLSLWGTPDQNEHARALLPGFMTAVEAGDHSSDVEEHEESSESSDAELEKEFFTVLDAAQRLDVEISSVRSVWYRGKRPVSLPDLKNRPNPFTAATFSAWVDDLTRPLPRLARRIESDDHGMRNRDAHIAKVSKELTALFTTPDDVGIITSEALDFATEFFIRYGNLQALRKVYVFLEDRRFEFRASNFHVILAGAAKRGDVNQFFYSLRLMIRKRLRPNARTWVLFHLLMRHHAPMQLNMVVDTMRSKDLFANYEVASEVAGNDIDRLLERHLQQDRSVESFMKMMEARLGSRRVWLASNTANRMAHVLFKRGRFHESLDVLAEMEDIARADNKEGVNTASLNTCLTAALRDEDPESAISYLKILMPTADAPLPRTRSAMQDRERRTSICDVRPIGRRTKIRHSITPDALTYELLFKLAWRRRYYNMLRVAWRFACAAQHVSFRMQELMWKSLLAYAPTNIEHMSRSDFRQSWAGKFALGLAADDDLSPDQPTVTNASADQGPTGSATVASTQSIPKGMERLNSNEREMALLGTEQKGPSGSPESIQRRKRLRQLLERDLHPPQRPLLPSTAVFVDLMERAWRLDVAWKEQELSLPKGLKKGHQFQDMLADGIVVNLRTPDEVPFP